MVTKNAPRERWAGATDEVARLLQGESIPSPFGRTEEGFEDFRGLVIGANARPVGLRLHRYDFSKMTAKRLIFADSSLVECRFDGSKLEISDYRSSFDRVSFHRADLKGSGIGGDHSRYSHCDFTRANLDGSTGLGGLFEDCIFDGTDFKNAVMGECSYTRCRFMGKMVRVLFGPRAGARFVECDLSGASFLDCGFSNVRFERCTASPDTLIFEDWPPALEAFTVAAAQIEDPGLRAECQLWIDVWEEALTITPGNIVDSANLSAQLGPDWGTTVFGLFQKIHEAK